MRKDEGTETMEFDALLDDVLREENAQAAAPEGLEQRLRRADCAGEPAGDLELAPLRLRGDRRHKTQHSIALDSRRPARCRDWRDRHPDRLEGADSGAGEARR